MKLQFYSNTEYVSITDAYYININWKTYKVKEWFLFNGWSIPKILWSLLWHPFNYKYLYAFFCHDVFYSNRFHNNFPCEVTRKEADDKLRNDIWWLMWWIVWLGVRLFWLHNFYRELEIEKNNLKKIQ